jgi:hypothetical protein
MCLTPNSGYVTCAWSAAHASSSDAERSLCNLTAAPLPEPPRADSAVTLIRFGRHRPEMWNGGD